jgi:hypothetical protein
MMRWWEYIPWVGIIEVIGILFIMVFLFVWWKIFIRVWNEPCERGADKILLKLRPLITFLMVFLIGIIALLNHIME